MNKQKWFWGVVLAGCALLILTNCQPAAAPAMQLAPSQVPPRPMPTVVLQPPVNPAPTTPSATVQATATVTSVHTAAATQSTSGIRITVSIGPTCPGPSRAGESCVRPYAGEFVIANSAGAEVARVTTDDNGQATVALAPGEYTVKLNLNSKVPYPRGAPATVTVPPGQYVEVTIQLDTGIR